MEMSDAPSSSQCLICEHQSVKIKPEYQTLYRVTSDCKPWRQKGEIGVCQHCDAVQKIVSDDWRAEIKEIYEQYSIYELGGGEELTVFYGASGAGLSRSTVLINRLSMELPIAAKGRLLDIGCGNGAWLKVFNRDFPQWILAGTEWSDKNSRIVEEIKGVEKLYTCPPEFVPGDFDMISMIHVLEHIPNPIPFLINLRSKLKPEGLLVIEVPNYLQNSYDLLIADHCMHYTEVVLPKMLKTCGYQVIFSSTDCVAKELTVVARKIDLLTTQPELFMERISATSISEHIEKLISVKDKAIQLAKQQNFGIFGTGIAAAWLFAELQEQIDFFVDEDITRIGKTHMGKPVYSPATLPAGAHVFIALPTKIATSIQQRLAEARSDVCYWLS